MPKLHPAVLAAALLFPGAALAQAPQAPPPMFAEADAEAAKAVIHRYFAAFTAQDYGAFRELFNTPYVMGGRSLNALPTLDDVTRQYQGIRDAVGKQDYSASRAANIRIEPLSGTSALAHTHWERLKRDGSLLNEGAEVLMMTKVDGRWRITGVLPEDLRQFRAASR